MFESFGNLLAEKEGDIILDQFSKMSRKAFSKVV
jgi:hypothetical protein